MSGSVIASALAGVTLWSFLEYVIHRWLGHKHVKNPFGAEHVRHHARGNYFAPSWKKALVAIGVIALLIAPAIAALGRGPGVAFVLGFVGFYVTYEVVHRLEHVHPGLGPYGRWARRHHFTHHFVDARVNHGVTSPVWDLVFGTYRAPGVIVVPPKLRPHWLLDPETNEVRAEWRDTFVLGGRARAATTDAPAEVIAGASG